MKQRKKKSKVDRWVVSTSEEIDAAKKKGLFKGMISLPHKERFELSIVHIGDLVYMVGDAIEQGILRWHEGGGEGGCDKEQHLVHLESLLYLLEDLLPHHFSISKDGSKEDRKKRRGFTVGDGRLFSNLGLIRKIVSFPGRVEVFYSEYEEYDVETYRKRSSVE